MQQVQTQSVSVDPDQPSDQHLNCLPFHQVFWEINAKQKSNQNLCKKVWYKVFEISGHFTITEKTKCPGQSGAQYELSLFSSYVPSTFIFLSVMDDK